MKKNVTNFARLKTLKPAKYLTLIYTCTFIFLLVLFVGTLINTIMSINEITHILHTDLTKLTNVLSNQETAFQSLQSPTPTIGSAFLQQLQHDQMTTFKFDQSLQIEIAQRLATTLTHAHYLYLLLLATAIFVFICYFSIRGLIKRLQSIKINETSLAELLYFNQMKMLDDIHHKHQLTSRLSHIPSLDELQYALINGQFELYYQPIVKVDDNKITGMEALLRWQHPTYGFISPELFIPICEKNNFIIPLGAWICQTACQQLKKWHQMGYSHLYVSVNLSTVQMHDSRLVAMISNTLTTHDLSPNFLRLEITETQIMRDLQVSIKVLSELRQLGVQLSLDDFGTGYSSLTYLKQFSFGYLKIDKSFIQDITSNITSVGIVEAIIKLGHSLGLSVITEGIETPQQLAIIKQMQGDFVQGYLYSKPLPVNDFTQYLRQTSFTPNLITQAEPYQFSLLTAAEREQTIKLVSNFFCHHGPLTTHLALSIDSVEPYVRQIVNQAIADNLSLIAIHHHKIVACTIVVDMANPIQFPKQLDPRLKILINFFYKCNTNFFHEKDFSSGHIANLLITAIHQDYLTETLTTDINIKTLELAKQRHFDFMCCAFTHTSTEKATLPYLIYNKLRLRSTLYKDFLYQGEYPFANLEGGVNAYIWELHTQAKLNYHMKVGSIL